MEREISIKNVKAIKAAVKNGKTMIFVKDSGRTCVILASKYGDNWWKKATLSDLRRVRVC